MNARDRRPRWRAAVFEPRPGMTDACRVLLLYLHDHMDNKGIVSIPRRKLAESLGIAERRITERMNLAKALGFFDTVRRGRPGVTAVYQATIPNHIVREAHHVDDHSMVRETAPCMVREAHLNTGSHGARGGTPSSGTEAESSERTAVALSHNEAATTKTVVREATSMHRVSDVIRSVSEHLRIPPADEAERTGTGI